jgi:hypothetical protein
MSTLTRVVFSPDATPPSTPGSITATALSQTAIRITWAASTDTGGSGLAGYRVYRSTTSTGTYSQIGSDLTTASLSYDDTGLTAGTTRYYRIVAFDGNANASSQSATANATTTTGAGDGNDGLIVSNFANYDPDAAQIISVDINSTLSTAASTGASVSFATESWWSGSTGVATIRPPTVNDGYAGFNSVNFWKNATKAVHQVNIRWEWRASDLFCANSTQMPKWIIVRTARSFDIGASLQDRAMFYINHMNESSNTALHIADCLVFCPAQGTVRLYATQNFVPGVLHSELDDVTRAGHVEFRQPMYIRATSGTDAAGNPIVDADEILSVEMRVNVMSTSDEPNGCIAMRIHRRSGLAIERACAWTYWPNSDVTVNTNYIADIDVMGGGYFNNPNSGDSNIWNKIGRRMTFATNLQPTVGRAWIGPPQGFLL